MFAIFTYLCFIFFLYFSFNFVLKKIHGHQRHVITYFMLINIFKHMDERLS